MKKVLLSAAFLGLGLGTFAQDKVEGNTVKADGKYRDQAVTVGLGVTVGFTDVKQYDLYPVYSFRNEYAVGAYGAYEKYFSSIFGLQGQLAWAKVNGTERRYRIVSRANTIEAGVNAIVNISNLGFSGKVKEKKTLVYLTGGFGLAFFRSSLARVENLDVKLGSYSKVVNGVVTSASVQSPGYSNAPAGHTFRRARELYIPVGLGFRYKFNQDIDLGLEITARNYVSDHLDAMYDTGADNDAYILTALTGTYKLGQQEETVVWADPLTSLVNEVAANKKKLDSMSKDSDNDGVADAFDKEANTAEGAIVDGAGVTLDLKDNSDDVKKLEERVKTLESATGTVNTDGTVNPAPSATFSGYLPSVYFSSNSARVDSKGQAAVAEIAKSIQGATSVTVVGNTDKSGTDAYNQMLGKRRAEAVISVLVNTYGFDKGIFTVEAKGEETPVGKAHFANRRVDVLVK